MRVGTAYLRLIHLSQVFGDGESETRESNDFDLPENCGMCESVNCLKAVKDLLKRLSEGCISFLGNGIGLHYPLIHNLQVLGLTKCYMTCYIMLRVHHYA